MADSRTPTIVCELTESELIARIQARLPPAPPWLLVGIGDDAAVVEPERNRVDVLSVDALVEGIHFDRSFVPPDAIGHRALAVNLSDLAAMGAVPRLALVSMALPATLTVDDFDAIVTGMVDLAGRHRLHIAGGNLTRSPGPLMIDVMVTGAVKRRQVLRRAGAKAGDEVWISGTAGSAAAGLAILRDGLTTSHSRLAASDVRLTTAYLRPEPRVRLGVILSRTHAATACIDLSDGVSDGLHRIADASGVAMTIDAGALPIEDAARAVFADRGDDPVERAVSGGDDYELLFTARPRASRRVTAAARQAGIPVTKIGVCTPSGPVLLRRGSDTAPLPRTGYSHFRG